MEDPSKIVRSDADAVTAVELAEFFVSDEERSNADAYIGETHHAAIAAMRSTVELLAFWVANEEYAVEILHIQEIIKLPFVTSVPRARKEVVGIISLRGTIVPIVDLRTILRLERQEVNRSNRILVLRADNDPIGLLVDRVTSVVRLERDTIEPKPSGIAAGAEDILDGVGRVGDRMLIVLDVPALLSAMDFA